MSQTLFSVSRNLSLLRSRYNRTSVRPLNGGPRKPEASTLSPLACIGTLRVTWDGCCFPIPRMISMRNSHCVLGTYDALSL
ncbi:hypothetical protein A0H81_07708 [Grifola frondosa]|uniref:Uncharacterized protein n=1 Tax=Grifola frondosa TaxID=5627 RepID=A0A1C7M8I2_GRIFR|nr:hypothetical protein A0H81_07708 [Grifola frondosa]